MAFKFTLCIVCQESELGTYHCLVAVEVWKRMFVRK
jgi:hypothetical protein